VRGPSGRDDPRSRLTHRDDEASEDYIERLAPNRLACRVKIADLTENLANNRRSPDAPGNAE